MKIVLTSILAWLVVVIIFVGLMALLYSFEKANPPQRIINHCDSLQYRYDSLKLKTTMYHAKYDSCKELAIVNGFKIQRVKYYMKIVDRRPNQVKFLRGWIRRSIQ